MAAPLRTFRNREGRRDVLSGSQAEAIDRQVNTLIAEGQARAAAIVTKHKAELTAVRDELIDKKTLEPARVAEIVAAFRGRHAAAPPTPVPAEG